MTGVCDVDSRVSALPTRKQEAAFEKMIDLQQTGPVIEYIERFDYLSELVHPVFQKEERLIPFFLRGLHRSIQMTVRLQKPVDIADCYRQAQWAASVMEPEYRRMEHNSRQQRARRQGQASHVAVKSRGAQASRVAPESRGAHYEDKVGLYTMTARPHHEDKASHVAVKSRGAQASRVAPESRGDHYEDKVGLYTMTARPHYEDKVGLYTMSVRPHYEDKVGLYTMTARPHYEDKASHVAVKSRGAQASRVAPESRGDHYEDKVGLYTMTVRPHYEDKVGLYTMTTRPNKCANRRTSAEKRKDCYLCGEVGHFKRNCPHAGGTKARRP